MENSRESAGSLKDSNLKRLADPKHDPPAQKLDFGYFSQKLKAKPIFNASKINKGIKQVKGEEEIKQFKEEEEIRQIKEEEEAKQIKEEEKIKQIKEEAETGIDSSETCKYSYFQVPTTKKPAPVEIKDENWNQQTKFRASSRAELISKIKSQSNQNILISKFPTHQQYEPYTHKYSPKTYSELLKSQAEKLKNWLLPYAEKSFSEWSKLTKFKVALISGPPGVGKTTTARLIPTHLDLRVIELNASDCRNKSFIQEKILPFVSNTSIISTEKVGKSVLVMDEVDGMSTGDEGGISALVDCIKKTKVPIICICNDYYSNVLKPLKPFCVSIKLGKADEIDTLKLITKINENEALMLSQSELEQISLYARGDYRFCLNILEFCRNKFCLSGEKDAVVTMNSFEIVQNLISNNRMKKYCIADKVSMLLDDYEFVDMLIMENYVDFVGLVDLQESADALAFSDTIITRIKRQQEWSLLPDYAHAELLCMSNSSESGICINFPKPTRRPKKEKKAKKTSKSEEVNQAEDLQSILSLELSKLY